MAVEEDPTRELRHLASSGVKNSSTPAEMKDLLGNLLRLAKSGATTMSGIEMSSIADKVIKSVFARKMESSVRDELIELSDWTSARDRTINLIEARLSEKGGLNPVQREIYLKHLVNDGRPADAISIVEGRSGCGRPGERESKWYDRARAVRAIDRVRSRAEVGEAPDREDVEVAYGKDCTTVLCSYISLLLRWESGCTTSLMPRDHWNCGAREKAQGSYVFCSGLRWSGASAVKDFLLDQEAVCEPRCQPRIFNGGAASVEVLTNELQEGRVDKTLIADFLWEKAFGIDRQMRSPRAFGVLRRSIAYQSRGKGHLATSLCAMFGAAERFFEGAKNAAAGGESVDRRGLLDGLFASITSEEHRQHLVLFDSVIRAWTPNLIEMVSGARMLAVVRDPRDVYATWVKAERPRLSVHRFIQEMRSRYDALMEALDSSSDLRERVKVVRFEDFVLDVNARKEVADWCGATIRSRLTKRPRFVADESARNIGVHSAFEDQEAINAIEGAFPELCHVGGIADFRTFRERFPTRSHQFLKVLSFSAMASKPMIEGTMSLCGREGEPGWPRRKKLCGMLFAAGGYDFIGLQHVYYCKEEDQSAVNALLNEVRKKAGRDYGVYNADQRVGVMRGDSLPLFYDRGKWRNDEKNSGVVWFRRKDEEQRRIGGGRFFVYGLFCARSGEEAGRCVWVYNLRLRHRNSESLDLLRVKQLHKVMSHVRDMKAIVDAPVIVLADTNVKDDASLANQYLRGCKVEVGEKTVQQPVALRDAFIEANSEAALGVGSQHNYRPPGRLFGGGRNDRILINGDIEVIDAKVLLWTRREQWPSYHFPLEGVLRIS